MMIVQNWGDALTQSLINVWYGVASFVPNLILAIVILAIGWIFAVLMEKLVESIIKSLKVDAALKSAGVEDVVKRAGHNLNSGMFVGVLVKWFVIVVFLMAAFDMLGLARVTEFLQSVVDYLPQVIVAVLILMVAVIVANAMHKVVLASARAASLKSAELLGRITKWAIWIFAIIAALFQLGIAPGLLMLIVQGFIVAVGLAVGLSFGLGGKDVAARILDKTMHNLMD
ncbi:MAG: hypothetical protein KGJ33_01845 [Patescibacteria group bacterium]|nr:hypothetical protein [Patescibacteria group bacterium]